MARARQPVVMPSAEDSTMSPADGSGHRRHAVTLRDVANAAKVDPSTASRALRPTTRGQVSPETRDRVLGTAKALGYRVNTFARGLKDQRSMTIGMLLPDLANPLFPPMVRGIEDELRRAGYALILANTDRDPEQEQALLDVLLARQVDGLILATAERDVPVLPETVNQVPTVLVNRTTNLTLVPSVSSDDLQGMGLAVRHLYDLGHRRIAHVGGTRHASTGELRYQHYLGWMHTVGASPDPNLVVFADRFTQAAAEAACLKLLEQAPDVTAITTASDLVALGCYRALRSRGLQVPRDVSVVGYNGVQFCDDFAPPLTTVHIPKYDIGRRAASLMLETIHDPLAPAVAVLLQTRLDVRASTAPPKEAS
jgi:LacI family transcriptional regulator